MWTETDPETEKFREKYTETEARQRQILSVEETKIAAEKDENVDRQKQRTRQR